MAVDREPYGIEPELGFGRDVAAGRHGAANKERGGRFGWWVTVTFRCRFLLGVGKM